MRYFNVLHNKAAEKLVEELKCNRRTDLLNLGFTNFPLKLIHCFVGSQCTPATNVQRKITTAFLNEISEVISNSKLFGNMSNDKKLDILLQILPKK